jgi:hypothetical protein
MIHDNAVVGAPLTLYKDTKANIEAIGSPVEGMQAFATDLDVCGFYNGARWVWEGEWVDYTITWTAATTNPDIGNGTLTGKYRIDGSDCHYVGYVLMGSTTTYGSSEWRFSLPVNRVGADSLGNALLLDDSNGWVTGIVRVSGSTVLVIYPTTSSSADYTNTIRSTIPFTWAQDDRVYFDVIYRWK